MVGNADRLEIRNDWEVVATTDGSLPTSCSFRISGQGKCSRKQTAERFFECVARLKR